MDSLRLHLDKIMGDIILYGSKLLLGIAFLIIGLWLIGRFMRYLGRMMDRRKVDINLRPFLKSLISALLKVMLFISVAAMIGIQVTSFIAVLGAAGLAIGLALQGSLANFAGGVLILLLKPFRVGDYIDTGSHSGTVREIQIFYTYLTTVEKQEVVIPNGNLSNNAIKNYSFHDTRRFDRIYKISHETDVEKAKNILENIIKEDPRFLSTPQHSIFIEELGDHAVSIHLRAWIGSSDFWDVSDHLNEKVKTAFEKEGIIAPPHRQKIELIKN